MPYNRSLGQSADWIVAELAARGIDVSGGSRFRHYAQQLARNAYAAPWRPGEEARMLEGLTAMRDISEVEMILMEFPKAMQESLGHLLDDAPTPRTDRSTPGRDRQLEWFVAATCHRGGMSTLPDREPDLWCEAAGAWIGLAVKRLRSAGKFVANLKDAAEQIQRCDLLYGYICMDVTLAWNPEMAAVLTDREPEQVAHDYRERLARFLDAHRGALRETLERFPKALGLLCIDKTFTHHTNRGWFMDQLSLFAPSRRNDRHRTRLADAFQAGWVRGSPNSSIMDTDPRSWSFCGPATDRVLPLRPR